MTCLQPVYEIRPRKDWHGFDLVGYRVPLGQLGLKDRTQFSTRSITRGFTRARIQGSFACLMNPALWSGRPIRQVTLPSSNSFFRLGFQAITLPVFPLPPYRVC